MHIEDQVGAKRCGHRPGKELVPKEEMADRIKAAVDAKTDPDFIVMARTDALAVEGLDSAIERALACVEAGADAVFPEAIPELSMYRKFADAVKVPVLANITEFGATPLFTLEELRSAGVAIALYPLSAFRAMNAAALRVYNAIRKEGTQKKRPDARGRSRTEAQEIGRPLRRPGGQHGAVHGRQERQRPALPRLRHPRFRRPSRVRGSRLSPRPREAAQRRRACRLQEQAQRSARLAGDGESGARSRARLGSPHGRDAHRSVGARHYRARGRRPWRTARA